VRTLTFRAAPAKRIYAANPYERSSGDHQVIDGAGNLLQTLTCPMDPSQVEAVSQEFIARLAAKTWIWMAILTCEVRDPSAQSGGVIASGFMIRRVTISIKTCSRSRWKPYPTSLWIRSVSE